MNCSFIEEHVIEYLEGELTKGPYEEFNQHLEKCESCQEVVAEIGLTYALSVKSQELEINKDFVEQTIGRLNKKEAKVIPLFYQVLKPIAVAASIALGIIIGNGELTVLDGELDYSEDDSYVLNVATPAEYSVWQSLDEDYGNED